MTRTRCLALTITIACVTTATAETVVSRSRMTGGTLQYGAFFGYDASATVRQTTLADGATAFYVDWWGPTGYVGGLAPASAVSLQGKQMKIRLDAATLLETYYSYGSPEPCVGTFSPIVNDGLVSFVTDESAGNRTSLSFQPHPWEPGGFQFETKVAGHTTESLSRFSGTCGGATIDPSSSYNYAQTTTHRGNIEQVLTSFP